MKSRSIGTIAAIVAIGIAACSAQAVPEPQARAVAQSLGQDSSSAPEAATKAKIVQVQTTVGRFDPIRAPETVGVEAEITDVGEAPSPKSVTYARAGTSAANDVETTE
jgi:hypothetical protein